MAIYIIELPHQFPPRAWHAFSESQVVAAVRADAVRLRSLDELPETLDEALAFLGRDLSQLVVALTDEEALDLYLSGIHGHGGAAGTDALGRQLQKVGVIDTAGLTGPGRVFARQLWQERLDAGITDHNAGDVDALIDDWLLEGGADLVSAINMAARGALEAVARVRAQAGLPVLR